MTLDRSSWELPASVTHELGPKASRYAVVVPVINEGNRIINQLQRMALVEGMPDILIADGGSDDGSMDLGRLADLGVRTLLVKTGPGRLSAQLRLGFAYALEQGYAGVITVDGSDKDGVDAVPSFAAKLDDGFAFVQGSRFIPGGVHENTPKLRRWAIRRIHAPLLSRAAGTRFTDTTNGFRGHSRDYLLHPAVQPFREVFDSYELLAYLTVRAGQLGLPTIEIPVRRSYPKRGKTPTKIRPVQGAFELLKIAWKASRGRYHP